MKDQKIIPLYDEKIPNSRPYANHEHAEVIEGGLLIVSKVSIPTLTIFLPPKNIATGAAVVICPGGGYTNLAMGHEGIDVARRYTQAGIAAFVLKYRIPNNSTMVQREIGPLQDAQRAIQIVRSRAGEWGLDTGKIGIMGFSAGGHLASTAGTHFQNDYIPNPLHVNLRPDFMILLYPVISFQKSIAHAGSSENLIGANASPEKMNAYSNEMQVNDLTPPAFLVHAKDDDVVPFENSAVFADSMRKHHIPVELFTYEKGGHGFGMNNKTNKASWVDASIDWLAKENFIKPAPDR